MSSSRWEVWSATGGRVSLDLAHSAALRAHRQACFSALKQLHVRPLALVGPSGSGKTRLLRRVIARTDREPVWSTARDLVVQMTGAMRDDRYPSYRAALAQDGPLSVEHLKDLRGRPAIRDEVRRLLADRTARGHSTVLTVTRARDDSEVIDWVAS